MANFGDITTSIAIGANQSVRRNSGNTAYEAYTPVDADGFVIASDVLDYADLASFPATGVGGVVYNALDTGLSYRWDGADYVLETGNVASVFGRGGAVTAQSGDYTTAIVADTTNKRYVTDAEKSAIAAVVAPIPCQAQITLPRGENATLQVISESNHIITITNIKKIVCSSGSITADFKINTTSITGLNAVAISTVTQDKVVSAANVVGVGDSLSIEFSANSSATYISFVIFYTRTLA